MNFRIFLMTLLFLGATAVFIAGARNIEDHDETKGWWQIFACVLMLSIDVGMLADMSGVL